MINFKVFKLNYKITLVVISIIIVSVCFAYSFSFAKSEDGIKLPIIMYHSVLKSKSGNYIVHPDTLENDLKYIQSKGYSTITMTDLIGYVYNDYPLPEKPIIITFDDGYYNNFGYAIPILKEANLNYGHLRWKDINELITDGCIEFQNHTYNFHSIKNDRKGCKKISSESLDRYTTLLTNDITKLQNEFKENCNGYIPNTFTYPFGAISKESILIIKSLGFKASLSCTSRS